MSPDSLSATTEETAFSRLSDSEQAVVDQLFSLSGEQPVDVAINAHLFERSPKIVTSSSREEMARMLAEMAPDKREIMLKRLAGTVLEQITNLTNDASA